VEELRRELCLLCFIFDEEVKEGLRRLVPDLQQL
jgi:hypothetical protein